MTQLIHSDNSQVQDAVEDAVHAACKELERTFPGGNQGGISSNFQTLLSQAMLHLLNGRSLLDGERGYPLSLPALVVDDAFFGNPLARGEAFLVTKLHNGHVVVLTPGRSCMVPIEDADKTWPTYSEAAKAAWEYVAGKGLSYEAAKAELFQIKAVFPVPGLERGYCLKAL